MPKTEGKQSAKGIKVIYWLQNHLRLILCKKRKVWKNNYNIWEVGRFRKVVKMASFGYFAKDSKAKWSKNEQIWGQKLEKNKSDDGVKGIYRL